MNIALKYCGSCNPELDLVRIGSRLAESVQRRGWELTTMGENARHDILVLLCGCPRTCIDRDDLRSYARHAILVAGKRVGWQAVDEDSMIPVILESIAALVKDQPVR